MNSQQQGIYELGEVNDRIETMCHEAFQAGWKQGMNDAMDMFSKGLNMDIISDSINKQGLWKEPESPLFTKQKAPTEAGAEHYED